MLKLFVGSIRNHYLTARWLSTNDFSRKVEFASAETNETVRQFLREAITHGVSKNDFVHTTMLREALREANKLLPDEKLLFVNKALPSLVDYLSAKIEQIDTSFPLRMWPFLSYNFLKKLDTHPNGKVVEILGSERLSTLTEKLCNLLMQNFDCGMAGILLGSAYKFGMSNVPPFDFSDEIQQKMHLLLEKYIDACKDNDRVLQDDIIKVIHLCFVTRKIPLPKAETDVDKILCILQCKKSLSAQTKKLTVPGMLKEQLKHAELLVKIHQNTDCNVAIHLDAWLARWLQYRKIPFSNSSHTVSLCFLDLCLNLNRMDLLHGQKEFLVSTFELIKNFHPDQDYRLEMSSLCQRFLKKTIDDNKDDQKLLTDLIDVL